MNEYEILKNYWNDSFNNMEITKLSMEKTKIIFIKMAFYD